MNARFKTARISAVFGTALVSLGVSSQATGSVELGAAQNFAVLAATTVTNTGFSVVTGDLGVWPNNAATGFPPGVVNGLTELGTPLAQQAQNDAAIAYNNLATMVPTQNLTGMDLGGMTLTPGVYFFASSAFLTTTLVLDAQGDPNAQFIFQMGSTLVTASDSAVIGINGADTCDNIFWQVGSSATLGTGTDFAGTILALTSITLTTDASINFGRAIALNGAVTMDTNIVDGGPCIPAPGAFALFGSMLVGSLAYRRRTR